jgi:hypothetical protein
MFILIVSHSYSHHCDNVSDNYSHHCRSLLIINSLITNSI